MSKAVCAFSLAVFSLALSACGQTGALQLPSDPDYDRRAKYLLYPEQTVQPTPQPVAQQSAAPTS
jgi:predicted small lipoprotein YifL